MTIGKKTKQALLGSFVRNKSAVKLTTGQMIKILRLKNEMSQLELAAAAGMTQSTVSSLESDRIRLGVERARVLARALRVHPAVLVFPDWSESELAA